MVPVSEEYKTLHPMKNLITILLSAIILFHPCKSSSQNPDLSNASYALEIHNYMYAKDAVNDPIFKPEMPTSEQNNLAKTIIDGFQEGKLKAVNEEGEEINSREYIASVFTIDTMRNTSTGQIIRIIYNLYTIQGYILKEIAFYTGDSVLLDQIPVKIAPLVESFDRPGVMKPGDDIVFNKEFFSNYNSSGYGSKPQDSYYNWLKESNFKADKIKEVPVDLAKAKAMLGMD
jgi:hypothetical protein